MTATITLRRRVMLRRARAHGSTGNSNAAAPQAEVRLPRVTRLMALAIRLEALLAAGEIPSGAVLAELGHVSRARITQIRNLTLLAPDLQERLLFLPPVSAGRDPITERDLRPIAAEPNWDRQRLLWARLWNGRSCERPVATDVTTT